MAAKGLQTDNLRGIGITNQRETTLLWDKRTGKPLHPALVWNDGRTAGVVKRMIEATPTKSLDHLRVSCHNLQELDRSGRLFPTLL
jgi:glycerol kinase